VFNDLYSETDTNQQPSFYIKGWNSSYTGLPIPDEEVRDWMNQTLDRIVPLHPTEVFEIGCGSGLVLARIAASCKRYYATDLSEKVLGILKDQLGRLDNELPQVELACRPADDFQGLEADSFDAVLLVSILQYFPGIDYLLKVLEGAVNVVKPGGFIFLGDIRNYLLLEAFHSSIQLHRAPSSLHRAELKSRVQWQVFSEKQLLVDPSFFIALKRHLPKISDVEIQLMRGRHSNELTKFRYDVTLRVGAGDAARVDIPWVDWQEHPLTLQEVRSLLQEKQPGLLGIKRVANARLIADLQVLNYLKNDEGPDTAETLRGATHQADLAGLDPEGFWLLGEGLGYNTDINWSGAGADGCYNVVFKRRASEGASVPWQATSSFTGDVHDLRPWSDYANNPTQAMYSTKLTPELRQLLREKLPEYMVPSAFVILDSMPLLNGKVNRRALPAPEQIRPELEEGFVPPRNPVEEIIVSIWADVLDLQQIGIDDNFFDLGGHSLLATQIMSRVREAFNIEVPIRSLFNIPTVAGLSAEIEAALHAGRGMQSPPIVSVARDKALPLSFAQQRLWFMNQLEPESAFYNIPSAVRLVGALTLTALERSFSEIIKRHEVLRTSFTMESGEPLQVISPPREVGLPVMDLRDLPEADREGIFRHIADEEAQRPFNLMTGPLLRMKLLRMSEDEHRVLFIMHHIISDGWSTGVMVNELAMLYAAFCKGEPSPLPGLQIQYADFACWQREWLQGDVLEEQLAYWRKQLAGTLPLLDLAADRVRPTVQSYRGGAETHFLPDSLLDSLKALSRQEGVTLFMTLLAAFKTLIHLYTEQEDLIIGSAIAGRNRSETEGLIGFFVNTLPLRTNLSGNPRFRELLRQVREVALGAYAHQDVPFEKLVEELQPERSTSHSPLVQVAFGLQNAPSRNIELTGLTLTPLPIGHEAIRFDLTVWMSEESSRLRGRWTYSTDLFDRSTVLQMQKHFETLLHSIVAQPDARLASLEMLSEAEKQSMALEERKQEEANEQKLLSTRRRPIKLSSNATP
jgi:SAM-dependent methyltransferase